jgi:polyhydroxyalkanoate synthesis regulator protein
MQKLASGYLETAPSQLQQQRAQLSEQTQALLDSPAELFSQLVRQNKEWMDQLQKAFLSSMNPARPEDSESGDGPS